jgi:hypothetical protein
MYTARTLGDRKTLSCLMRSSASLERYDGDGSASNPSCFDLIFLSVFAFSSLPNPDSIAPAELCRIGALAGVGRCDRSAIACCATFSRPSNAPSIAASVSTVGESYISSIRLWTYASSALSASILSDVCRPPSSLPSTTASVRAVVVMLRAAVGGIAAGVRAVCRRIGGALRTDVDRNARRVAGCCSM